MFKYYEGRLEVLFYDLVVMRDFCEKNVFGFFDFLLKLIIRDDNRLLFDREFL